ncbi:hypothetical protein [Fundicoccus culcitae]|uniref:Uncharacterized protein n=1 Tax=Fundicoccus culcitae TaxID=2969821 RepID=A0ABY5P2C6_9LACT|nr:hypothetical protein [Fundicoccus culcitae]UUX32794.1 hypothetical protein NRE15_07630 [Fundicoccus culcitae]
MGWLLWVGCDEEVRDGGSSGYELPAFSLNRRKWAAKGSRIKLIGHQTPDLMYK